MLTTGVAALIDELNRMANAQFESPEFRHLLSIRFTPARARCYAVHLARYQDHRRDCWGYVQGAAPLPVKRLIWAHETEELINDPRADADHSTLAAREAEVAVAMQRLPKLEERERAVATREHELRAQEERVRAEAEKLKSRTV
jgi:hypothetical protein